MVNSIYRVQFCLGKPLQEHQNGKSKRHCQTSPNRGLILENAPESQILRQGSIQYGQWIYAQPLATLV
jgi:hypothetical protein